MTPEERIGHAIDEAVRALTAARSMTADTDGPDRLMSALAALEAARTAREHAFTAVALLADEALQRGASFEALGVTFDR